MPIRKKIARLLHQLPRESRVFAAVQPATQWGWNEILNNKAVFLLETLVWMKSRDAQRKVPLNKPTLFMPEFMPKRNAGNDISKGIMAADTDTIKELLARPRY